MTARKMLWGYVVIGVLTLIFELFIRMPVCMPSGDCANSLAKGIAFSIIWPAGWVVYLKGVI
jgi:hypothetical protein